MEKRRFENLEYCKAAALLLVLVYHYWVLSGSVPIPVWGIDIIVLLGGEIGVTLFFILSGFGIYCLFRNNGRTGWLAFVKSRFYKVSPLYYFSILLVIALTSAGSGYLSKSGLCDIVLHMLFMHNLGERFHGSINGALWTMGVIFQYYLIALPLYKCMIKNKNMTLLASILLTMTMKLIVYKYILPAYGLGATQYFVYGRQLFTALDNFVLGMYAADLIWDREKNGSGIIRCMFCLGFFIILIIYWGKFGNKYGIYSDSISGYIWHSVLAILITGGVVCINTFKDIYSKKILYIIGKNEYGIYLLHLPILQNLLQSPLLQKINSNGYYIIGCLVFLIISFMIGFSINSLQKRIIDR